MSEEAYRRFRATIPFSDEQIAAVLDELADEAPPTRRDGRPSKWTAEMYRRLAFQVRAGHMSGGIIRIVADRLVKTCPCGRPALYRFGMAGRCSAHKAEKPGWQAVRETRMDAFLADREMSRIDRSDLDRSRRVALGVDRRARERARRNG
jgi:hypothetical protein